MTTLIPHSNAISDWLWRKQREQEGQRGGNSSSQPRRRAIEVVQMADDEEGLTQMQPFFCLVSIPLTGFSKHLDDNKRRENFSRAVIFGPIFICSSCSRTLFENGVTKITDQFKEKVNQKRESIFEQVIQKEIHVDINFNGKQDLSGSYICNTCKAQRQVNSAKVNYCSHPNPHGLEKGTQKSL